MRSKNTLTAIGTRKIHSQAPILKSLTVETTSYSDTDALKNELNSMSDEVWKLLVRLLTMDADLSLNLLQVMSYPEVINQFIHLPKKRQLQEGLKLICPLTTKESRHDLAFWRNHYDFENEKYIEYRKKHRLPTLLTNWAYDNGISNTASYKIRKSPIDINKINIWFFDNKFRIVESYILIFGYLDLCSDEFEMSDDEIDKEIANEELYKDVQSLREEQNMKIFLDIWDGTKLIKDIDSPDRFCFLAHYLYPLHKKFLNSRW